MFNTVKLNKLIYQEHLTLLPVVKHILIEKGKPNDFLRQNTDMCKTTSD